MQKSDDPKQPAFFSPPVTGSLRCSCFESPSLLPAGAFVAGKLSGQGQFDTSMHSTEEQSDLLAAPRAAALMTAVIFHACYWKKEVTVCSKPRTNQELDFWAPLPVCFPLRVTCL